MTPDRGGFTLIELLIAITVFAVVLAAALELLGVESRAMAMGADRVSATQNLQYAANWLTRDIRSVGTSVPPGQPFLVYADSEVIAFNADYATNLPADPSAIYYDPHLPPGAIMALTPENRIQIPLSNFWYPSTSYVGSPAELLIFFFRPDSSTPRPDDYVLMRQVNDRPPELVARGLLRSEDGRPFFQYFRLVPGTNGARVDTVRPNALPLAHTAPVHPGPADVGSAATIDSIRGVRVSLASTDDAPGNASERIRSISRVIWLPNAGQAQVRVCGDEPMFGSLVTANVMDEEGVPVIEVTWFPAVDETGGEEDIVRYVVWKRLAGESSWGDPYLSVPAGSEASSYSHIDRDVQSGQAYEYAVAAQDCTPTLSPLVIAGPVLAEISNP
jgi:prepilin-type N-terminal cleavage/methylation domain-containing protein